MDLKFIIHRREGAVSVITLNRPDVLNSLNREMALELRGVLDGCNISPEIRVVLLSGAGKAFCAGQDLAEVSPRKDGSLPDLGEVVRSCYNPIILALRSLEKPVVCAVNGVAAGAGASIALACDIVLASRQASFIQSFSKVGLIPDSGGTFTLPRLIGLARASALSMLGEKLGAEQAREIGLVYRVCEAEVLQQEALALASSLTTQPTRGFALLKRALNASFSNDLETQLALEAELQSELGQTEDYREGVEAFLEKRRPQFTGR